MQAMPEREDMVEYVRLHVPHLEVVWEDGKGAWSTWSRALALGGADEHVHLEDDVTLCKDFLERIEEFSGAPYLVQLFNRSGTHTGARPGSTFVYTCGFYLPAKWGGALANYAVGWTRPYHKTGTPRNQYDYMLADFMAERKLSYLQPDPPLVQHTPLPSTLKHHGDRSSPRFVHAELRGHPFPEMAYGLRTA